MVSPLYSVHKSPLCVLPNDLLFEVFQHLGAEEILALEVTNWYLRSFIQSSKILWTAAIHRLGERLPLPLPPSFAESNASIPQLRHAAIKAISLEARWTSGNCQLRRSPRFLRLSQLDGYPHATAASDSRRITMLRLLPGGKQALTTTYDAHIVCWDLQSGMQLGEWRHGGVKVESLDVDVALDDQSQPCIVLAVSVEHHYRYQTEVLATYRLHTVRIDIHNDSKNQTVTFKPLSEACWRQPFYIVSIEGDYAAAYSCDLGFQPIDALVVLIMNWKTRTAVMVDIDSSIVPFFHWPTMQVLGDHIVLYEERCDSPAICVIRIPETLFPIYMNTAAPKVPPTISLSNLGGELEGAYQTRFSKHWRHHTLSSESRILSIMSVSNMIDDPREHKVQVRTFMDALIRPQPCASPTSSNVLPPQQLATRTRAPLHRDSKDGRLTFTFCLGRYGYRPLWIEQSEGATTKLVTMTDNGGSPRALDLPSYVDLPGCHFIDWDDAEGILCALTPKGVWVVEF